MMMYTHNQFIGLNRYSQMRFVFHIYNHRMNQLGFLHINYMSNCEEWLCDGSDQLRDY